MQHSVVKPFSIKYRPDIDGLRAVAVLAVLFYHFKIPPFSGGFIGVDIFFVISGYLITKLVWGQTADGTFSFKKFYVRRIRRLFPALFVTLASTLATAAILFSPEQMARLGKIVFAALISVSNIAFWREAGYFDTDAATKPLLHTWSLGVEEQFYLIWPALIFLCVLYLKRAHILAVLTALIIVGLVAVEYVLKKDVDTAFYLTPFRLSEFGIGAILVWLDKYRPSKALLVEVLFALGLALTLVPIIMYSDQIRFPGLSAFVPCFGAALLIFIAPNSKLKNLLANRFMVGIGLMSYSLYLVHWPLYVFTKQAVGEVSLSLSGVLIVASFILAALSYRFVETPFRNPARRPKLYKYLSTPVGYVVGAVLLLSISANARLSHGWKWRTSSEINNLVNYKEDFPITNRMGTCYLNKKKGWREIPAYCYDPALAKNKGKKTYLLLGSSHAADLWPGFAQVFADENVFQLTVGGCLVRKGHIKTADDACNLFNKFAFEEVLPKYHYDLVIISGGLKGTSLWANTQKVFDDNNQDFVAFGGRSKFSDLPTKLILKYGKRAGVEEMLSNDTTPAPDHLWLKDVPPENFFSLQNAICPPGEACQWIVGERLTYRDKTHFNTEGSVIVAQAFKDWLAENR